MTETTIYRDGAYLENNPTWHEEDSPWKARQITKMLQRNQITPATVCEIGCGAGEILNTLAVEYGDRAAFSGFDISPQAYEICRKKAKKNLEFHLQDLLENSAAHFDVVMAIDVFEHIDDYLGFLRKLRPKGQYKLFHIPLDLSVLTVLRSTPIMRARSLVGHIHYFTKEIALAALQDTGYEVIDHFYTGDSLELPNRSWQNKLMKLPRKFFFALHPDMAVRILGGYSLLVLAK